MGANRSSIFFLVASLFCIASQACAQQIVNSPVPIKVETIKEAAADLSHRLGAMGYSAIALRESNGSIVGTALKAGHRVRVVFDSKGELHIKKQ